MKRCPKCDRIYPDNSLNFCLDDGESLLPANDNQEAETAFQVPRLTNPRKPAADIAADRTAVFPNRPAARNTQSKLLWVGAAAIVIAAGAFLVYRYYSPKADQPITSIAV